MGFIQPNLPVVDTAEWSSFRAPSGSCRWDHTSPRRVRANRH